MSNFNLLQLQNKVSEILARRVMRHACSIYNQQKKKKEQKRSKVYDILMKTDKSKQFLNRIMGQLNQIGKYQLIICGNN